MAVLEIRARGEVLAVVRRPRTAGSENRYKSELSSRFPGPAACALEERSLATAPSSNWKKCASLQNKREGRRNRSAPGASAGGKQGDDRRLRPELTCFPPVVGDRKIAGVSAANPRHCRHSCPCDDLRYLRYLRADCDGWVALVSSCLRVCDVCDGSVSGLCVSVPLWFS
jgi:hypothetical protein